jgi:CMP/dCMP kinase
MIIAIDGPAASGKGTLAKRLAAHFGLPHLDTGLLYRAVARALIDSGDPLADEDAATRAALALEPSSLDDPRLRGAPMGEAASIVSAFQPVRDALLAFQRGFAGQAAGAVLDGRDIGTVVCPGATVKLFVTASLEARAQRRHQELLARNGESIYARVLQDMKERDQRDSTRKAAPLTPAPDALVIDTTALSAEAALAVAVNFVSRRRRGETLTALA